MKRNYLIITAISCVLFLLAGCQQQAKVMSSKERHIKVLSQKKLGDRYQLALEITPPGEDTKKFTDTFTVNLKDGDTLEVTCQGIYRSAKVAAEPAVVESDKTRPKIEFESLVHDFGKVGPGRKLSGEFKFTNTGDAPLKITKVERCCGVIAKVDKEQIAPGDSGVLKVQYTSSRTASKITKRLYVNSNDKKTSRAMLTIQAETVQRVTCEPERLKLSIKKENAGCPPITLKSIDNKPFSITRIGSTGDTVTAEFDSSIKATQFVLQPKVDPEKLKKKSRGYIRIGLAYPEQGEITIFFEAPSIFSIRPSLLIFYYDKGQQSTRKKLAIINNYGEDFEIESTSSKIGNIKVLNQKKIDSGYEFDLEITLPDESVEQFTDVFTVNVKGGEKRAVACRGIYRAPKPDKSGE